MRKTIYSEMSQLVCEEIVQLRKGAELTQRDLAKKLKREHSFVARIEQGERRVDLVEFYVICKACGVKPEKVILELVRKF